MKAAKPARPWVEPEQLPALLDATTGVGSILVALLAGGGLRIGEALGLRWQHADLGTGSLHVVDAKTPKGVREVHLTPALREQLVLWRAEAKHTTPSDFVIHTSTGGKHNPSNLRRDVLAPAVAAANGTLDEAGIAPLGPITFHSLRRTYASFVAPAETTSATPPTSSATKTQGSRCGCTRRQPSAATGSQDPT